MSQFEYYSDPLLYLPHRAALASWGIVLIVLGSLAGLISLVVVAMAIAMSSGVFPNPGRQSGLSMLWGGGMYAALSVALIWLGIGSRQGRRWVRPLMIIGSTLTILFGCLGLMFFLLIATRLMIQPAGAGPQNKAGMLIGNECGGIFIVGLMIVLPAVLLWFYGRASVQTTVNQMDLKPRWTDRCPTPVLGWMVACIFLGIGSLFGLFRQIFPLFTVVLVGVPAAGASVVLGLAWTVGGIMCYRLRPSGWIVTFAAFAIQTASMLTFAIWGDRQRYLDLVLRDFPADQQVNFRSMTSSSLVWPVVMNGIALAYGVWIRKCFKEGSISADASGVS